MRKTLICLVSMTIIASLLLSACRTQEHVITPVEDNDDWKVTSPEKVHLDTDKLDALLTEIDNGRYENIHSILMTRHGQLAFEVYFPGHVWAYEDAHHQGARVEFDKDTPHNLASVTKSVTSMLFGTVVDQGLVTSVDAPMMDYFPDYSDQVDPKAYDITLHDMLIMGSGLDWDEGTYPYSDRRNDLTAIFWANDPTAHIITKNIIAEPGTTFNYNGGNTCLIAEVVRNVTGQRLDIYSEQALFGPLGITDYEWDMVNSDFVHASGNLFLRPRDLAKLGQLVLNGGVWNGQQLLSEEWIRQSVQPQISVRGNTDYGYQWWIDEYNVDGEAILTWQAKGWGGQRIVIIPERDAVIVFTGGNYTSTPPCDAILRNYLLPALQ